MKTTHTPQKRSNRNPQNIRRGRGRQSQESFLENVGDNLGSVYDAALDGVQSVGRSVSGAFRPRNVLPIAIGSFVVGAIAGVLGARYFPVLRDSEFVSGLGTKLNNAKTSVGDTFTHAKESVMKAMKEATGDIGTKTAGSGGVSINPSRLA
jgi:hypothetical protein